MITTLGVSGIEGSFSEEAAMLYAAREGIHSTLVYLEDMDGVLSEIEKGRIDIGIFPVVNLKAGLVKPAFLAMGKYRFTPIDDLRLTVEQCLLTFPGTPLSNITTIASHPQGLVQCQRYLQEKCSDKALLPWSNTAKAAKDVSEGILPKTTAVIASARTAKLYGLNLLAKGIEDEKPNITVFLLAKKYLGKPSKKEKISCKR